MFGSRVVVLVIVADSVFLVSDLVILTEPFALLVGKFVILFRLLWKH